MFNKLYQGWVWRTERRRDFYAMAAGFIADGKPVFDTLQVFESRWREKKDSRAEAIARVLAEMRGKGESGRALRLAEALAAFCPPIEAMAIDAGERAGDVAEGLRMASKLAETQSKISATIRGELVYPFFLVLMLVGLLYMLKTTVIPVFTEISPRYMWPVSARVLGAIADNAGVIIAVFGSAAAALFGFYRTTRGSWTGDLRALFDRMVPPWSLYRSIAASVMMTCFSAFMRAGVPFSAVIDQLMKTASQWERGHLARMKAKMRRGLSDAEAMAGDLFDEQTRWEITVYGGMTSFAQALDALARRNTEATLKKIKGVMGYVRTMIMFAVAGMIIWVYGTFFQIVMSARQAV